MADAMQMSHSDSFGVTQMPQAPVTMARRFRAMICIFAATMAFPGLPDWAAAADIGPAERDSSRTVYSMDVARSGTGGAGHGAKRGLLIGAVAGAGAGIGLGHYANSLDDDALVTGVGGWAAWIGAFTLAGAGIGALIGAIVGSTDKAELTSSPTEENRAMVLPPVRNPAPLNWRQVTLIGDDFRPEDDLKRANATWPLNAR